MVMSVLMFSHGAEHPFVVLSRRNLILLILYKLFILYTRTVDSHWSQEKAPASVFVEYRHLNAASTGIRFLALASFRFKGR